jgi:hypothetical protein
LSRVSRNFKPLYGVMLIITAIALSPTAGFAAVRQFDVPLNYKSRVVPPEKIRSFPGGVSTIHIY